MWRATWHVKRFSRITVMYNYFGKSIFPRLAKRWHRWGWCTSDWPELPEVFAHSESQGIPEHRAIYELQQHSEVVNFVVRVRNNFLNSFAECKKATFPGVDGEALFVGTVLHSLDHTLMGWNLEDPLWLDVESERFATMAELGRVVRVGFVEDLPWLLVKRRCRGSPVSFFRGVYKYACTVNRKFADSMDTCIIK
mmetsp:Transcript_47779/g.147621  ORF Transcript_47779/g.147621 Transcript_47779/m.147621 type:complete len:195 (+) Transcript_47779:759-1343(+)